MPISARAAIQKRIDKLQTELNSLHNQASEIFGEIESREFALQELEAVKKSLPDEEGAESSPEIALRRGSDASKARDVLREVRRPQHVDRLLEALGKEVNKKTRASLAGQLAFYARKNQIFEKTGPNEFGLLEWKKQDLEKKAFLADGEYRIAVPIPDDDEPPALDLNN
ncbi:MAG TPA: hypothetical protein VE863_21790 [Pyrinomonadaceae bacterium]|jgi:hypothetical protein|nr:hypothetical protein [Pyrinomonadaceae bacterium]